ncbi:MAG: PD-(D/E)XK nuclease family protein [Candidatus Hodarchaeales archaeon]
MNKFRKFDVDGVVRIDWWEEHHYSIKGKINDTVPSVTKILGDVIAKGYGFDNWLKSVGPNASYLSRKAADSGSKLHNAFEQLICGSEIDVELGIWEKDEWKKLQYFYDWYNGLDIEPIAVEQVVYSTKWIAELVEGKTTIKSLAGTADFICRINGEVWLLDWKTGNAIYDTSEMQLAAYAVMWNEMVRDGIIDAPLVKRVGVVHVGSKHKKVVKEKMQGVGVGVTEVDVLKDKASFENTVQLWARLNPTYKKPIVDYPPKFKLEKGVMKNV